MQTQQFASQTFTGFLTSSVIEGDKSNPLGGLTFTYQLANDSTSRSPLNRIALSSFANFPTDVSRQLAGSPPSQADRINVDTVGFSFQSGTAQGPLLPGAQSSLLVIQTSAASFNSSPAVVSAANGAAQVLSFTPVGGNLPPSVVTNTGSTAAEGGTDPITSGELRTSDQDTPPFDLKYTVTDAPDNGTLQVDGAPADAFTQGDIDNGRVTYLHGGSETTSDDFSFSVSDGTTVRTGTFTFKVTPTNDPPDARNDTATGLPDTSIQINVLANDTDPDGDQLMVVSVGAAASGQASIGAGGVVSYQPNPEFGGVDSFTYTIGDGRGGTDTATVTVVVEEHGPFARDDTFKVSEDTIRNSLDVLANDSDPTGLQFRVIAVTQGSKGVVEIGPNGANVLYTPDPNFVGADSFTYTIVNTFGETDTAKVTLTVLNVGDPPTAVDDNATVTEDGPPAVIAVLANDFDSDGGALTITKVTQGANGTVSIRPGGLDLVYQPAPNFNGADTFTYTVTDDAGETATATVRVTVLGSLEPPDAVNDLASVSRGASSVVIDVLANDVDLDGDPLTITDITAPGNGTAVLAPDGKTIRYTPSPGFTGTDVFQYTVTDPSGFSDSAKVLVDVNVNRVDARDDVFTAPIGIPMFYGSRGVLANDVDSEGDAIVKAEIFNGPSNGTVVLNADGSFTYTSKAGFTGTDSFTYAAFDAFGASDIAKATINVVDTAPAARNDAFSVQTNSGPTFINVLADDTDPEGKPLRIIAVTQPKNGKVTIVPGGLLYEPNPGFEGIDEFTYTASDDERDIQAAVIDIALVTLFVHGTGVPYFPMNDDFARPEDMVVTLTEADLISNDYNPSKLPVDIASVSNPVGGSVLLNGDGSVTFTPTLNFVGFASFNYRCAAPLNANMSLVEIEFTQVLDSPVAGDDAVAVNENTGANTLDVLGNDSDGDGDSLLISAVTQGAHGSLAIGLFGLNVVYTPQANFIGSDTFTYTVSDGNGGTDTATVTVSVANVDSNFHGTAGDDVFLVRRHGGGTQFEVFVNDTGVGAPFFSALIGSTTAVLFDTLAGNDRLIVDLVNGSPLPTGGIDFLGGGNTAVGDQLIIRNGASTIGSYLPSSTVLGEGLVTLDGRNIDFTGVEPVQVSDFSSFTATTPNANDVLTVTQPAVSTTQLAGTSGGIALAPLTFNNVGTFIIDAATADAGAGNDALIITASGAVPNSTNFLEYRSGTGANTLDAQSGITRIDSTVAGGGTLDTTLSAAAELVTHRFRQTSLTLAAGSRATVLSAGTLDAVSRLNALNIGTGATFDINDNALVLDYTGTSPEAAIRAKIIEGRGGVGVGNGNWNGTGITSGAAAAANELDPESRSIGYADNGTLPLGAYTTFRGQPVDATSVLIAFTRTGDANLDSLVNDDDATILGAFYPNASATWAMADFDYTDTVDDNDATLLGAFYDPSATPFPAAAPPLASVASTAERRVHDAIFADIGDADPLSLRRRR
ncbi:MAG: Ig-like domain-containing protein [Pirellulales bacterium]